MAQLLGCFSVRSTRCEGYLESHEFQLSEGPVIRTSENESGRYHGHRRQLRFAGGHSAG